MFQGMLAVLALADQLVRPALNTVSGSAGFATGSTVDVLTVMKEKSLQGAPHRDNL